MREASIFLVDVRSLAIVQSISDRDVLHVAGDRGVFAMFFEHHMTSEAVEG